MGGDQEKYDKQCKVFLYGFKLVPSPLMSVL